MATAEDIPPTLTLELGPAKIPCHDFQKVVGAFTGLLSEISTEVCGNRDAVGWEISVSEGSLLISADLPEETDVIVANRIRETVRKPSERIRRRLLRFPRAVPATRILAGPDRLNILVEDGRVLDRHPSQVAEYGTVEGTLDTLSARGRLHFTISEPIWNVAVRCTVPDDLVELMRGMWRQRVAAHGMVHYDRDGVPTRIRAEEVSLFPCDETPLGTIVDLFLPPDGYAPILGFELLPCVATGKKWSV